jgi:hypothetical protein
MFEYVSERVLGIGPGSDLVPDDRIVVLPRFTPGREATFGTFGTHRGSFRDELDVTLRTCLSSAQVFTDLDDIAWQVDTVAVPPEGVDNHPE